MIILNVEKTWNNIEILRESQKLITFLYLYAQCSMYIGTDNCCAAL